MVNNMHYLFKKMVTLHRYRNWKIEVFGREHGIAHVHVSGPEFRATIAILTAASLQAPCHPQYLEKCKAGLSSTETLR